MKKTLFTAILLATLAFPFASRAQVVDNSYATSAQIDELKSTLISLLTQLIAQLQAQLNQILAQQAQTNNTSAQTQNTQQNSSQNAGDTNNTTVTPPSTDASLKYGGAPANSCHASGLTWNCGLSVQALNSDIFVNTTDNPGVNLNSFTITKDGSSYTGDTSGISVGITAGGGWIPASNGAKLAQGNSDAINTTATIDSSKLPAGSYNMVLNSVAYYSINGSNGDGSPKLGDAQTMSVTDHPSFSFTVNQ